MLPATMEGWAFWLPIGVLATVFGVLVTERVPKVVVVLLGASLLLVTHTVTQANAFASVDWNVIFLLVGMMVLVNILRQTGAIEALGRLAIKTTRGNGWWLLALLSVVTALLSAVLDNVTTVVMVGAVTCAVARQYGFNPVPYLVAETLASNIGGTATLIGDPPNIMIGSAVGLGFTDFLVHLAPFVMLLVPLAIGVTGWCYHRDLTMPASLIDQLHLIEVRSVITDWPLMIQSLVVLSLVLLAFMFHGLLGLEAGTIALAGASVLMLFESKTEIWDDVEWTTIFFFIGLFVIVGAVAQTGVLSLLGQQLLAATQGNTTILTLVILWVSGVMSALIDNIPYTATMIPLVQSLGSQVQHLQPLWWALSLGACLGGNGSLIGATANVLVADMAKRQGYHLPFMDFLKVGGLVTFVSLVLSSVYLWLRYLA
jgi:Na+/H+ antiporter NhaD/arsenite permease-like protein